MQFNNEEFEPIEGESVLDCLIRNKQSVEFSCKVGSCQSCLMHSPNDSIEVCAQKGLKPTLVAQGFFLACQQQAKLIESVNLIENRALFSSSRLVEKHLYSADICRLRLVPTCDIYYHPGQFINLRNPHNVIRSYSLASVPAIDNYLELHIRRKHNGAMSNWLFDKFNVGDYIDFQSPAGNCFYTTDNQDSTLILVGTGTGASPLLGILRDAIWSGHRGEIRFYHGGVDRNSLYLDKELKKIVGSVNNIRYYPCISSPPLPDGIHYGYCNEIALADLAEVPTNVVVFLCGNPDMVKSTHRAFYIKGVHSTKIYSDPFNYKDLRTIPR